MKPIRSTVTFSAGRGVESIRLHVSPANAEAGLTLLRNTLPALRQLDRLCVRADDAPAPSRHEPREGKR